MSGALRRRLSLLPLVAVTAIALLVNVWGLEASGYGNTYYAAATRSMTESWSNFFFGAFDPGGFISVDKPPVFLWVDALSARIFGYSSLSLLLPSAVAGSLSVALLWAIMRRYFGVTAATIAALVLALTPISVAVNRLNLPEPFLVLALIGAAGCILRSLEPGRWLWWTVGAGLLIGVAFNTKMLVGWIPGPALALALVIGLRGAFWLTWQEWVPRMAVFATVALLASASWMLVVDAWPESGRPYVGGSTDNTVYDLALGYNGVGRVDGENGAGGPRLGAAANAARFGPGGIIAGQPHLLRLFDAANGGQIAWFLPFALIGGAVSLWRWRDDNAQRAAVVLWFAWVLLFAGVFSYAQGIYHSYYASALAPGVAAVAGVTCVALPDLLRRHRAWVLGALAIAAATLYAQMVVSGRFEGFFDWLTPLSVATVLAGVALTAYATWRPRVPVTAGMAVMVAGLLLMPAAWSAYESAHAASNTTLPQAGPRNGGMASRTFGSQAFDAGTVELAAWLVRNAEPGARWHLAVASAQNASTLIAAHGLSVMAIGGFSGGDPTITAAEFGEYVAAGDVRYVLAPGGGFGGGFTRGVVSNLSTVSGAGAVMVAVQAVCEPVRSTYLAGRVQGMLYDCAGLPAALGTHFPVP